MMNGSVSKDLKVYYSEISAINKKKFELKIKHISFGNSNVYLISFQDVSYLEIMHQFSENNDYKNKVLTTLSNKLRTPLNGALIPLEKLLSEKLDNPLVIYDNLETAYNSLVLLQNVLNNVVDFALINSNQLYLNYEDLDFYKFLEDILELFRKQAQEKGLFIDVRFDHLRNVPRVIKTDFQRLSQILVSLLNNSMKNTFEGGISLFVNVMDKREETTKTEIDLMKYCIKITVEDTGVGINEEKMKNIQKCLKSSDILEVCANLNKIDDCGLGIIISHCLALLLGPKNSSGLQVSSETKNGTEFSFNFEAFQEKEDFSDSLSMVEEKSREFSKYSVKTSSKHSKTVSKQHSSVISTDKRCSKNSGSRHSITDFRKLRRLSNLIPNDDNNIDSEAFSTHRDRMAWESERSTGDIINFLQLHNLQPRKMLDVFGKYSEILIVDDDSFNLLALESILSKFNLKGVRAFNGQQAIDKIREKQKNFPQSKAFSIVFLDYHMPIKNGIETTQEIIKMFREEGLIEFPVVACTAFGARDLVEKWSQAGMSDFVVKPVSFQKVEGILKKFGIIKL